MAIKLYDLAGAEDDHRFSPYCWRVKMALAHKGIAFETLPWRFTEKDRIAASGQGSVPVMEDNDRSLHDSWEIANYLDETYQDGPALFPNEEAKAATLFLKFWTERVLHPLLMRLILTDVHDGLHEKDKDYFRTSREKMLGTSLEAVCEDRETHLETLGKGLAPLRATLDAQPFLGGSSPSFADYIVFGAFQWARCSSATEVLVKDDSVKAWRQRLLEMHDGMAANAKRPAA
ncbi:glutathione S-transferase family protein [Pelagibius sp. Alg239-R121]|uniref:glutathione S-transferase family protein n=1 Tax=Pelagibius sp. Alg239-R121 TaxID=2993448 RepID=UPI0024A79F5E|nr:glutathione S-transferase family protein [Pelagibius sp. Alg239-R121]